jgi:NADPH-dependent 2,4-dienoyl-CoA reductase/sulfur reductase-like enzyme
MVKRTFPLLIVGAGPAGMAAAIAASEQGVRAAVLDDNASAGGQIWRNEVSDDSQKHSATQRRTAQRFQRSSAELFAGRRVVSAPEPRTLDAWNNAAQSIERYYYENLILATGARERFLPFPGWTLPGVFGAGGLQALVRGGYDVRGKRVVVAGTGPLLLAVAAHLRQDGAEIVTVCEQASLGQVLPFGMRLMTRPAKLAQAASLLLQLRGVPHRHGCWPVAAHGAGQLEAVELADTRRRWTERCDMLACGFHLVSNTELPALLGCRLVEGKVEVDSFQRTSEPNIFCAGETAGIAGLDAALLEGTLAGLSAAGALGAAGKLAVRVRAERAFSRSMNHAFRLRPEVLRLADAETVVCRCEDVRFGEIAALMTPQNTWTDAKLQTRCGMGPCQGRICGPIMETLFAVRNESVRPPLFPLPLGALASEELSSVASNHPAQETQ